jgi:hypothetical protein
MGQIDLATGAVRFAALLQVRSYHSAVMNPNEKIHQ